MITSESRSIYSGPIRRTVERGERLSLDNGKLIKGLDSTVSGIGTQVGGIEDDVGTLQSQVSALQSTVTTLQSTVTGLQSTTSGLQTQVNSLTTTVNGLTTTVNNQTTAINERALGCMGYRGLAFSGTVAGTVGLNLSGTLGPLSLPNARYKLTLQLAALYGGSVTAGLHLSGSYTGRSVWMSGGSNWSSSVAEFVFDLSGSIYFDVVVVGNQGSPQISGDAGSFFECSHIGPAR